MIQHIRLLLLTLLAAGTLSMFGALAAEAGPPGPPLVGNVRARVAGIAISVLSQTAQGAGQEVEFEVRMTTTRFNFLPQTVVRGVDSQTFNLLPPFTSNQVVTMSGGLGGLGDASLTESATAYDLSGRPFTGYNTFQGPFRDRGIFASSAGNFLAVETVRSTYIEGELPALDFGDGSTINATSLATLSAQETNLSSRGGPRITSRWRGTFTHSYASNTPASATVASRCCSDDRETPERGPTTTFSFPGYVQTAADASALYLRSYGRTLRVFSSATRTNSPGSIGRGDTTGTFNRTLSVTGNGSEAFYVPDQITNTVSFGAASAALLEVPTATNVGLAILATLLMTLGVVLLRRS